MSADFMGRNIARAGGKLKAKRHLGGAAPLIPAAWPRGSLPGRDPIRVAFILTRQVLPHTEDVRTTHRIREVASTPLHGFTTVPDLVHSSRGFGLCFSYERAHGRVGGAPNEQMNVFGQN